MPKFNESGLNLESLLFIVKTKKEKELLKQEISNFLLKYPENQKIKVENIQKDYPILYAVMLSQNLTLHNFVEQSFLDLIKKELDKIEEVEVFSPIDLATTSQQEQEKLIQNLENFVKKHICQNFILDISQDKKLSGGVKIVHKGYQWDLSLNSIISGKIKLNKN